MSQKLSSCFSLSLSCCFTIFIILLNYGSCDLIQEREILEYLAVFSGDQLHKLWQLPPSLLAVAIPSWSSLFNLYISELETQLKGISPTKMFSTCMLSFLVTVYLCKYSLIFLKNLHLCCFVDAVIVLMRGRSTVTVNLLKGFCASTLIMFVALD